MNLIGNDKRLPCFFTKQGSDFLFFRVNVTRIECGQMTIPLDIGAIAVRHERRGVPLLELSLDARRADVAEI